MISGIWFTSIRADVRPLTFNPMLVAEIKCAELFGFQSYIPLTLANGTFTDYQHYSGL